MASKPKWWMEPEARRLVVRAGLPTRPDLVEQAVAFLIRTNRARRIGVWTAVVAALCGVIIPHQEAAALFLAQIAAGYVVGSVAAELFFRRADKTEAVRRASLVPRTPSVLLPAWARYLPWMTLPPVVLCPLLLLGDHPVYSRRTYLQGGGVNSAEMAWFRPSTLVAISLTAALTLAATCLLEWRVSRRQLSVADPEQGHLDLVTRALSARATAGTAGAVGLALLAGLGSLADAPMRSYNCYSGCEDAYDLPLLQLLVDVSAPLMLVSVVLFGVSTWLLLPRRLRSGPPAVA